jgi:hypothetical protein
MPCVRLAAIILGFLIAAAPACAQSGARPTIMPRPFESVSITQAPLTTDPSFVAFRQRLAAIARSRVFEELARVVVPHGFFWDRDFANAFDPQRSGAENLAAAVRLEHGGGAGWDMLADLAAEPGTTRSPAAPGVLCAPGQPTFDQVEFDRLIDATHTNPTNWVFPRTAGVEIHVAPQRTSVITERLGSYFIRIVTVENAPAPADPLRVAWSRVVAPSGKFGYAAPNSMASLTAPQLCYIKDVTGLWSIAGFVGRGS